MRKNGIFEKIFRLRSEKKKRNIVDDVTQHSEIVLGIATADQVTPWKSCNAAQQEVASIFSHVVDVVPKQLEWSIRWKVPIYVSQISVSLPRGIYVHRIDWFYCFSRTSSSHRCALPINTNYYHRTWWERIKINLSVKAEIKRQLVYAMEVRTQIARYTYVTVI